MQPDEQIPMAQQCGSPGKGERMRPKVSPGTSVTADTRPRPGNRQRHGFENTKLVDADSFGGSKDGYSPMTVERIVAALVADSHTVWRAFSAHSNRQGAVQLAYSCFPSPFLP